MRVTKSFVLVCNPQCDRTMRAAPVTPLWPWGKLDRDINGQIARWQSLAEHSEDVAVIGSFSVPGIPGGTIIAIIPVLMSAGLPIEGAGILLGVDTYPDMFRTTANVTGDLTAAVVLGARETTPVTNQ